MTDIPITYIPYTIPLAIELPTRLLTLHDELVLTEFCFAIEPFEYLES